MEVSAAIFPRRDNVKFGMAPLTSMFFIGESDRRKCPTNAGPNCTIPTAC